MDNRILLASGAAFFVCFSPARAKAEAKSTLSPETKAEVDTLEREIAAAHVSLAKGELSADGCTTACKALDSMRRATSRLCAIDPGPSCEDAQRRTQQATERVAEVCPWCAPAPNIGASAVTKDNTERPAASAAESASPRRGGCAGCTTTGAPVGSALVTTSVLVLVSLLRRRRRR